jgi:hypothetical protein
VAQVQPLMPEVHSALQMARIKPALLGAPNTPSISLTSSIACSMGASHL